MTSIHTEFNLELYPRVYIAEYASIPSYTDTPIILHIDQNIDNENELGILLNYIYNSSVPVIAYIDTDLQGMNAFIPLLCKYRVMGKNGAFVIGSNGRNSYVGNLKKKYVEQFMKYTPLGQETMGRLIGRRIGALEAMRLGLIDRII